MTIRGFLESADDEQVRGWAFDPDAPSASLEIVVRRGGDVCAQGRADMYRADLLAAGHGDGCHAFRIDISSATPAGTNVAELEVFAQSGSESYRLPRTQRGLDRSPELAASDGAPVSDSTQFPVFVLGAARSGTSAVTLALLRSGHYHGSGEGHLLPLAHALLGTIDRHYERYAREQPETAETALRRVPAAALQRFVRRGFVQLVRDLFPTGRWVDKTPNVEMVRAAPLMLELWPNSRFIFMKRRVIENLLSRRRKFPSNSTDMHYSDWVAVMTTWLRVRSKLASSALEVDHRELVLDPERTAGSIAQFLELPEAAAEQLRLYVSKNRPEQTDQQFGATYTLDDLRLTPEEARGMRLACDPVMAAYGYEYGSSYYTSEPQR